jgi:hypothetical protein
MFEELQNILYFLLIGRVLLVDMRQFAVNFIATVYLIGVMLVLKQLFLWERLECLCVCVVVKFEEGETTMGIFDTKEAMKISRVKRNSVTQ